VVQSRTSEDDLDEYEGLVFDEETLIELFKIMIQENNALLQYNSVVKDGKWSTQVQLLNGIPNDEVPPQWRNGAKDGKKVNAWILTHKTTWKEPVINVCPQKG